MKKAPSKVINHPITEQLQKMDRRLDDFQKKIGRGGSGSGGGLESRISRLEMIAQNVLAALEKVDARLEKIDERLRILEVNIAELKGKMESLPSYRWVFTAFSASITITIAVLTVIMKLL